MRYHFQIHKKEKSFLAECIELPGCLAQADSIEELNQNMERALNLYLERPMDSTELFPLPNVSLIYPANVVAVRVDPLIGFAFMVRYNQIKHGFTRLEAADKLGYEDMYSHFLLVQQLEEQWKDIDLKKRWERNRFLG